MEKFEIKQAVELNEHMESDEIKREVVSSLDAICKAGIFNSEFLNDSILIVFGNKKTYKFQNNIITEVSKTDFLMQDFMQGRRVDFTGISPRNEFEKHDINSLNDKQFLPFIFIDDELTYNEFITHEIAHNLFDRQYVGSVGKFEEKNDTTDVSLEYRNKIKKIIIPLAKKHYPSMDIEKFSFSRQQIAEIFAMMHEREFCRRVDENFNMHNKVKENIQEFSKNPEEMLTKFNKKHNRNCTMDDFYQENHTLSLIITPLLEEKYPEWQERNNLFWK